MKKRLISKKMKKKKHKKVKVQFQHAFICSVVVLLVLVTSIASYDLWGQLKKYDELEQKLRKEIEMEKERSEEIDTLQVYVQTEEYLRSVAREKLGLVEPGSIIFQPKSE